MFSERKKAYIGFGATLLISIIAFGGYFYYQEQGYGVDPTVEPDSFSSPEEYFQYQKAVERAYRKDTYGGDTPEETLELFITALEEGDMELASKYYIVEKQTVVFEDLKLSQERGFIDDYLEILRLRTDGVTYDYTDIHEMTFYNQNGESVNVEFFVLNPLTKKWKLEDI